MKNDILNVVDSELDTYYNNIKNELIYNEKIYLFGAGAIVKECLHWINSIDSSITKK